MALRGLAETEVEGSVFLFFFLAFTTFALIPVAVPPVCPVRWSLEVFRCRYFGARRHRGVSYGCVRRPVDLPSAGADSWMFPRRIPGWMLRISCDGRTIVSGTVFTDFGGSDGAGHLMMAVRRRIAAARPYPGACDNGRGAILWWRSPVLFKTCVSSE